MPVAVVVLLAMVLAPFAVADDSTRAWHDPVATPTEIEPLSGKSLLLDVIRVGGGYVAIGERGNIVLSADGKSWQQTAAVPTRSTLTALSAVGDEVWAVGHDGVILHSADAGHNWNVQRKDPLNVVASERDARQGAPLLGVLFQDANNGIAIGGYSLMLTTRDGGHTWIEHPISSLARPLIAAEAPTAGPTQNRPTADDGLLVSAADLALGQEADPHLNGIARTGGGGLFIVGERGSAFRSRDDGATWHRLQLPYDGSMFGVIGYAGERVLAFGLRGHVYNSNDLGDHWQEIATGTELSLMGGAALADGGAVIVGANGVVLVRHGASAPFTLHVDEAAGVISNVATDGTLGVLVGENGVREYTLP